MKPKHLKTTSCRHKHHTHLHHDHSHPHHRHLLPQQLEFIKADSTTDDDEEDDVGLMSKDIDASCSVLKWNMAVTQNDEDGVMGLKLGVEENDTIQIKRDLLIERLRIYNNLLKFHKAIKEDQVYLYRTLQDIDELYLRNTAVILRLGFCPCLVHQQTSPIGDKLMKIHRNLRIWDKKMEGISEVVKESSNSKSATAVLQILKICEAKKLGRNAGEFNDVAIPEIVWDLKNKSIEQIDLPALTEEWTNIRIEVRTSLFKVQKKFQEICLEFGVRRGPAETPSSGRKSFDYTASASIDGNENVTETNETYRNDDEEGTGDGLPVETPDSLSSFF